LAPPRQRAGAEAGDPRDSWVAVYVLALALGGCALSHPPQHSRVVQASLPKTTAIPPTWTANAASKEAVADDWPSSGKCRPSTAMHAAETRDDNRKTRKNRPLGCGPLRRCGGGNRTGRRPARR